MSISTLFKTAPLGATILVSNGQPRPHARFNRKLARWEMENYSGVLIAVEAGHGHRPTLSIRKGELVDEPIAYVHRYGLDTSLRFDVQRRPTPGSVRVLAKGRRELLHLAANRDAAEKWAAASNYANAVLEDVTEPEAEEAEEAA